VIEMDKNVHRSKVTLVNYHGAILNIDDRQGILGLTKGA
jgi:hypothetical protein